MKKQTKFTYMFTLILLPCFIFGQRQQAIDLANLYKKGKLKLVNREIKIVSGDSGAYLKILENKKEGIIWLPVNDFKNGTIEIEMRGKDVFQRSFIGIAFHGVDDINYDAVYCRPFNFFAKDSVRRIHAVQYISHPDFTWGKLRNERNSVFEKEIINPPNHNDWFTMKLVIESTNIKVYINDTILPSLIVEKLNNRTSGKIGLFTGDSSGGDFKIIKINYKK
ncbi:family 16 glycoside hydrolase [Flavobacterium sp. LM4]|uniref:family 16 glycoside hydrolase n=1 Tax=Flavobacterium sp. LM4 TaxID=1938609 RepID=UPI000F5077CA|nr:family 16 glycoside hydrolase [Flavobacterium sp. LM4]